MTLPRWLTGGSRPQGGHPSWVRWASLALLLVSVGLAVALLSSDSSDVVARVKRIDGDVQRDHRGNENAWQPAALGDELSFGDAVRTGASARASVVLADGSALDLDPDTTVRFMADAQQSARFRVDTGLAMFEATGAGSSIATSTGLVRVDPRSRVRIVADAAGLRMEVSFGRASFIDANEAAQSLLPGDELVVRRGEKKATVLRREDEGPRPGDDLRDPRLLASANSALDTQDIYDDAGAEAEAKPVVPAPIPAAPQRADVTLRAGEYATIHQPRAGSTHVRLRLEDACNHQPAIVETAGPKGRFRPAAQGATPVFTARPGTTRYRVRCENKPGKVAVAGSIRVIRDAAVRRVPLRPPTNGLDLDGRRYTVMYQNRLPSVIARYTKVPAGARSRVVVQSGTRLRTYEGEGNSVKIVSGQLEDGVHVVFLETLDGKVKSPETTLRIAFDNAAPTASFDQRGTLERDANGHAQLSGVVPQGARVSLEGQVLVVDASGRFSGNAVVQGTDAAVALRVEHPRAGLHYYVRHVAGAGESVTR
jgi:hypothetical protein